MQHDHYGYDQDWEDEPHSLEIGDDIDTPVGRGILITMDDTQCEVWCYLDCEIRMYRLSNIEPWCDDVVYYPAGFPIESDDLPFYTSLIIQDTPMQSPQDPPVSAAPLIHSYSPRIVSALLDCCIFILENDPPAYMIWPLRWFKRELEREAGRPW